MRLNPSLRKDFGRNFGIELDTSSAGIFSVTAEAYDGSDKSNAIVISWTVWNTLPTATPTITLTPTSTPTFTPAPTPTPIPGNLKPFNLSVDIFYGGISTRVTTGTQIISALTKSCTFNVQALDEFNDGLAVKIMYTDTNSIIRNTKVFAANDGNAQLVGELSTNQIGLFSVSFWASDGNLISDVTTTFTLKVVSELPTPTPIPTKTPTPTFTLTPSPPPPTRTPTPTITPTPTKIPAPVAPSSVSLGVVGKTALVSWESVANYSFAINVLINGNYDNAVTVNGNERFYTFSITKDGVYKVVVRGQSPTGFSAWTWSNEVTISTTPTPVSTAIPLKTPTPTVTPTATPIPIIPVPPVSVNLSFFSNTGTINWVDVSGKNSAYEIHVWRNSKWYNSWPPVANDKRVFSFTVTETGTYRAYVRGINPPSKPSAWTWSSQVNFP